MGRSGRGGRVVCQLSLCLLRLPVLWGMVDSLLDGSGRLLGDGARFLLWGSLNLFWHTCLPGFNPLSRLMGLLGSMFCWGSRCGLWDSRLTPGFGRGRHSNGRVQILAAVCPTGFGGCWLAVGSELWPACCGARGCDRWGITYTSM